MPKTEPSRGATGFVLGVDDSSKPSKLDAEVFLFSRVKPSRLSDGPVGVVACEPPSDAGSGGLGAVVGAVGVFALRPGGLDLQRFDRVFPKQFWASLISTDGRNRAALHPW